MEKHPPLPARKGPVFSDRAAERAAAVLVISYLLTQTAAIAARVASGADQETAELSVAMIRLNADWYAANQWFSLAAAFSLCALTPALYHLFSRRDRMLALWGAAMLWSAGMCSTLAALTGLALTQEYGGLAAAAQTRPAGTELAMAAYASLEPLRQSAGRAAFTFAALALLAHAVLLIWHGMLPRWLGWAGAGVSLLMAFIWVESAAALHRLGGGAYLLWLTLLAGWLLFRGTRDATPPTRDEGERV